MLRLKNFVEAFKNSTYPLYEPKFIYGILYGVAAYSIVAIYLLGKDITLFQGQIYLSSLAWFSFTFAIIYYRLGRVENFNRFILAFFFKAFIWECDDVFFLIQAFTSGILIDGIIIRPEFMWFVQTCARNFTIAAVSFIFIYKHISFSKQYAFSFLLLYGLIAFGFMTGYYTPSLLNYVIEVAMIYWMVKS